MSNTLSKVRQDLEQRLHELEPLVHEHAHLQKALDALKGAGASIPRPTRDGPRPGPRTKAPSPASGTATRGRPRGTGARAQQALKLVHANPGITIAEMAKKMKIKPNYLYRVLPELEKAGHIRKHEKGYHGAEASRGSQGADSGEPVGGQRQRPARRRARRS